jgi:hypothetical protein
MIQESHTIGMEQIEHLIQEINQALEEYRIDHRDMDDSKLLLPLKLSKVSGNRTPNPYGNSSGGSSSSSSGGGYDETTLAFGKGMAESKVQYVRQMVYQYLVCREVEVKAHIESALMALFRFSEDEKNAVLAKNEEERQDTLTTITSFFTGFT